MHIDAVTAHPDAAAGMRNAVPKVCGFNVWDVMIHVHWMSRVTHVHLHVCMLCSKGGKGGAALDFGTARSSEILAYYTPA